MTLLRIAPWAALACALLTALPAQADQIGRASWYGHESGARRADGKTFRPNEIGAAHRTLPQGTRVRVTDLATGRHVDVTINDYGPARWTGRIIDLSLGAARALGIVSRGVATVRVAVLG